MKRKDGQRKIKALRNKAEYIHGFRNSPNIKTSDVVYDESHSVVSMFSGCGGLDLGAEGDFEFLGKYYLKNPVKILMAADNDPDAVETYNLNLNPVNKLIDLEAEDPKNIPSADILMGGFPCQDFSSSGPKTGLEGKRGKLYKVMASYMREHQPKIVIGENVPHLMKLGKGVCLQTILDDFENEGYTFKVWELYGPDYYLPQSRRRLFLIGVRNDLTGFPLCPEKQCEIYNSVDVALKDLENIVDETITNQSQYFVASKASSGGGQGDNANQVGKVGYCIRANSRGRIQYHYKLDRRLTVRECARLQSFPDEFVFPYSTQRNVKLIGNAVPPIMGHTVMQSIVRFLADPEQSIIDAKKASYNSQIHSKVQVQNTLF